MELNRAVWAEINLDNLAHNISEVRRVTNKGAKVTAVIKADGYGHGASEIAKTLLENGADRLAVATLTEAVSLRKRYKEVEILVLGFTEEESIDLAIQNNLIQTIYTIDQAKKFNERAKKLDKVLKIHIKLDTGMTRIGMMSTDETVGEIEEILKFDYLDIEGIYTHFALADDKNKDFTHKQVENFKYVIEKLKERDIKIPIEHVSNSAAIIDLSEYNFDMVRAGVMLYGLYPSDEVSHEAVKLKEVMSLHAKITRVENVTKNTGVSYGHKFITGEDSKIASLPLGYADGYSRSLSFKAETIIKNKNKKAPVIGRICMDQCMIDVTGVDVKVGDEVILFGSDDYFTISINDIAEQLGTINYEIVCMINKRVPRVYKKNNEIVKVVDYIMEI